MSGIKDRIHVDRVHLRAQFGCRCAQKEPTLLCVFLHTASRWLFVSNTQEEECNSNAARPVQYGVCSLYNRLNSWPHGERHLQHKPDDLSSDPHICNPSTSVITRREENPWELKASYPGLCNGEETMIQTRWRPDTQRLSFKSPKCTD